MRLGLAAPCCSCERTTQRRTETRLRQACVEDLAYDRPLEGNRANFLFDLIQTTGDEVSFVETIVVALLTATEHWATDQLFALAVLFAKAEHAAAGDAVHTRFDRHDAAEPFLGDEALVELDGLNGFACG